MLLGSVGFYRPAEKSNFAVRFKENKAKGEQERSRKGQEKQEDKGKDMGKRVGERVGVCVEEGESSSCAGVANCFALHDKPVYLLCEVVEVCLRVCPVVCVCPVCAQCVCVCVCALCVCVSVDPSPAPKRPSIVSGC